MAQVGKTAVVVDNDGLPLKNIQSALSSSMFSREARSLQHASKATETIVILKPDATIRAGVAAEILQRLLNDGFIPLQAMEIVATPDVIRQHYTKKTFKEVEQNVQDLIIRYMCCGSILVIRFTDNRNGGKGVVQRICEGDEYTNSRLWLIQKDFMINIMVCAIHSSRSDEDAFRELEVWRPHFARMTQRINANQFIQQYINRNRDRNIVKSTKVIREEFNSLTADVLKLKSSTCGETEYARNPELLKNMQQIRRHRDALLAHYNRGGGNNISMLPQANEQQTSQLVQPMVRHRPDAVELVDIMIEYAILYQKRRQCCSTKRCLFSIIIICIIVVVVFQMYR